MRGIYQKYFLLSTKQSKVPTDNLLTSTKTLCGRLPPSLVSEFRLKLVAGVLCLYSTIPPGLERAPYVPFSVFRLQQGAYRYHIWVDIVRLGIPGMLRDSQGEIRTLDSTSRI